MVIEGRSYLFTDATVNIDPDAETLSEIAILANDFALTRAWIRAWPCSPSPTSAPRPIR